MGVAKIYTYKSTTVLQYLCSYGLGYETALLFFTKTFSVEAILFIALYAGGIYLSKAKLDKRILLGFAALAVVLSLERAFLQVDGFSAPRPAATATTKAPTTTTSVFTGFSGLTIVDSVQLLVSVLIGYVCFTLYKA